LLLADGITRLIKLITPWAHPHFFMPHPVSTANYLWAKTTYIPQYHNRAMYLILISSSNVYGNKDTTQNVLRRYNSKFDMYEYYLLHHALLYGVPKHKLRGINQNTIETLLNEAPNNGPSTWINKKGWSVWNRFYTNFYEKEINGPGWLGYAGLDYMNLLNEYILYFHNGMHTYYKPSQEYINAFRNRTYKNYVKANAVVRD
jgi:hypothetical protein